MPFSTSAARMLAAAAALMVISCSGASSGSRVDTDQLETKVTSSATAAPPSPTQSTGSAGPFNVSMTFDNTPTGANGECRGVPQASANGHITGSGTWTATRRAEGGFDIVAEYALGARHSGTLDNGKREATLEGSVTSPNQASRTTSTQRFNEDYTRAEGEAQLVVTLPAGGTCAITYALSSTFVSPLLPPGAR